MEFKPTTTEENCGWCAYRVPAGAHICGACGARRAEEEINAPLSHKLPNLIFGGIGGVILGFILQRWVFNDNDVRIILACAAICAALNTDSKATTISWHK